MNDNDATKSFGKVFVWLAWLLALGLLVFVFQKELDQQINPNTNPQSFLSESGKAEVHLQQNRQGHYVVQGAINETAVTFLLDTGATQVSIPSQVAQQLSLPRLGQYSVQTANGNVVVTATKIDQLSIGNIYLYNVAAHINPGMKSNQILLGMSALKKIEFSQRGKQLTLREY
jgi:aspartyl protease family protein